MIKYYTPINDEEGYDEEHGTADKVKPNTKKTLLQGTAPVEKTKQECNLLCP